MPLQATKQIEDHVQLWKELLSDPDWQLRTAAARALGSFVSQAAVREYLIHALADSSWHVTEAAIGSLAGGSPCAATHVLPYLNHAEADVRLAAAKALGRLGNPVAADALCLAAADPEIEVRQAALRALASVSVMEGWA